MDNARHERVHGQCQKKWWTRKCDELKQLERNGGLGSHHGWVKRDKLEDKVRKNTK